MAVNRKPKRQQVEGLWVAPEFSLSKRTGPRLMPLPSSKPGLLNSSDPEKESSMARILELANVALSKKKRA
jgi:hypothetical protein